MPMDYQLVSLVQDKLGLYLPLNITKLITGIQFLSDIINEQHPDAVYQEQSIDNQQIYCNDKFELCTKHLILRKTSFENIRSTFHTLFTESNLRYNSIIYVPKSNFDLITRIDLDDLRKNSKNNDIYVSAYFQTSNIQISKTGYILKNNLRSPMNKYRFQSFNLNPSIDAHIRIQGNFTSSHSYKLTYFRYDVLIEPNVINCEKKYLLWEE